VNSASKEDLKTVAQIDAERAQYLIKAVVFTSWDDARFRALKMR
jgi:DNA uptake protein ComE-like DNA-binding protein